MIKTQRHSATSYSSYHQSVMFSRWTLQQERQMIEFDEFQ